MLALRLSRTCASLIVICSLAACDEPTGADADAAASAPPYDAARQNTSDASSHLEDAKGPTEDARLPDVTPDASTLVDDAGVQPDANVEVDASTHQGWQDGPSGAPPAPQTKCTWNNLVVPGSAEVMPAHFTILRIDSAGNIFIAGQLSESRDFGTGLVALPWLTGKRATTVFKFDKNCTLQWVKALLPHDQDNARGPVAIGFDAQDDLVVITSSVQSTGSFHAVSFQASSIEFATMASTDGTVVSEKVISTGTSPLNVYGCQVLAGGQVFLTASAQPGLDLGMGPIAPNGMNGFYNAFFSSTGELLRGELFGHEGDDVSAQLSGSMGELVLGSSYATDYYGQSIDKPTLLKLDANRTPLWSIVVPPDETTLFKLESAQDGTLVLSQTGIPNSAASKDHSVSVYADNGSQRYRLPITVASGANLDDPIPRLAPSGGLVAVLDDSDGTTTLGNSSFDPIDDYAWWITLLAADGTPRWLWQYATTIGGPKDFAVDSAGNVVVAVESTPTLSITKLASP